MSQLHTSPQSPYEAMFLRVAEENKTLRTQLNLAKNPHAPDCPCSGPEPKNRHGRDNPKHSMGFSASGRSAACTCGVNRFLQ